MPKKYVKVSECPPKLEEIIELINLLPENADCLLDKVEEIDRSSNIWKKTLDGTKKRIDMSYLQNADYSEATIFRSLVPERIADYCIDSASVSNERFDDLLKAKNLFYKIAEINKDYGAKEDIWKESSQTNDFLRFFTLDYKNRKFSVWLGVSPEGFIKPGRSELLEIFEQNDVPFHRIRFCQICQKLFWAKKTNTETCDKKCADKLGNQKRLGAAKAKKEQLNNHFQSRKNKNGTL